MVILLVDVAGEQFGINAADVLEVTRAVAVTPVRGAPECVDGVIDVRGTMVPLIDLRRRLGRPTRPIQLEEHLVVVRVPTPRTVAFRVDRALDLIALSPGELVSARAVTVAGREVSGIARTDRGLIVLFDPAALLSQVEAAELERALTDGTTAAA